MLIKEIINESSSRSIIVVDVQPAYLTQHNTEKFIKIIEFCNNSKGQILMFVNAEQDGLTDDTQDQIKEFWEEHGFDSDNWSRVKINDKGYGYMRSWMDYPVERSYIIKIIRELYSRRMNDSRDLPDDVLKNIMGSDFEDWMIDEPLSVNWIPVSLLRKFSGSYLIGGHEEECLAEVSLLMNAFNIKYKIINSLVYN